MTKVIELKDLHCALGHMTYKVSGFASAYKEDNQVYVEAISLDVVILDNVGTPDQMYKLNDVQKANFENRLTQYPQFHQFIEKQL
jgi:1-aminocyclopropane-1-carboxylate deaminase/D-cysteine desulfhydrase-like pyridoxal-dependent ACC family enzyme